MKKNDFRKKNRTMQYIIMALCGVLCVCAGVELATAHWWAAMADIVFVFATSLFIVSMFRFDKYIEETESRFADEFTIMLIKDIIKDAIDSRKTENECNENESKKRI